MEKNISREQIIKDFYKLLNDDFRSSYTKIDSLAFWENEKVLFIRSCPEAIFKSYMNDNKELYQQCSLTVIGKETDRQTLDKYGVCPDKLVSIDGTYTVRKIMEQGILDVSEYRKVVVYSRYVGDLDYINIFELLEGLQIRDSVYCIDGNFDIYEIHNIAVYKSILKLEESFTEWYWRKSNV